jgi:hypothetical protein
MSPARRVVATVSALATLIGAVLGVVFLLVPGLKPLPRDRISASVAVADIENNISVGRWARLQYPKSHEDRLRQFLGHKPKRAELQFRGMLVYVKLTTEGFKRRSVRLSAKLYDARTRRPSANTRAVNEFPESGKLKIRTPSRESIQLLFVSELSQVSGRFFLRVSAFDDSGILAYADSKPFVHGRFAAS